jgi:hypothetical protein
MSLLATAEPAERPRTSVKRRIWSWVGVVAIVVVIGSLLATLRFDYSQPEPLSIDSWPLCSNDRASRWKPPRRPPTPVRWRPTARSSS